MGDPHRRHPLASYPPTQEEKWCSGAKSCSETDLEGPGPVWPTTEIDFSAFVRQSVHASAHGGMAAGMAVSMAQCLRRFTGILPSKLSQRCRWQGCSSAHGEPRQENWPRPLDVLRPRARDILEKCSGACVRCRATVGVIHVRTRACGSADAREWSPRRSVSVAGGRCGISARHSHGMTT